MPGPSNPITELFTRLWSNRTKSSRARLTLRVFPDLDNEELKLLTLVNAYVNALDDLIDLERIDCARDSSAHSIYPRTILMTNHFLENHEVVFSKTSTQARYIRVLSNPPR